MGENLTRQILSEHLVDGELTPGEPIALKIDQTLLQDATGTMACMQFEQLEVPRVKVDRAVQYIDHNVIQLDYKNPDDHRMLQALARKYGIHYSRPGNGICHYVHIERFAKPGGILVGADSHTTTSGALGMIAIGGGGHGWLPLRDRLPRGGRGPPREHPAPPMGAGQGRDPRVVTAALGQRREE